MNAVDRTAQENDTEKQTLQAKRRWGISGSTLKLIAVITMFIDHLGLAVVARIFLAHDYLRRLLIWRKLWNLFPWISDVEKVRWIYDNMRSIGRIAFPIFCFLLVEGFQKTGNVKKYALRLGIFALISEIPFDLAFKAKIFDWSYQNVYFTLLLGLLTMIVCDRIAQKKWSSAASWDWLIEKLLLFFAIMGGALAAELLQTDYGAKGIFCIMVLYLFRRNRVVQLTAGAVSFLWEMPAPLAFLPLACYNGRRGLPLKYVFYVFYPLHLFLLYLLCVLLGIGWIAVV